MQNLNPNKQSENNCRCDNYTSLVKVTVNNETHTCTHLNCGELRELSTIMAWGLKCSLMVKIFMPPSNMCKIFAVYIQMCEQFCSPSLLWGCAIVLIHIFDIDFAVPTLTSKSCVASLTLWGLGT